MIEDTEHSLSAFTKVSHLAESQWSLITAAQAERLGVNRLKLSRFAKRGMLTRLHNGVYRISGAAQSPYEPIKAIWLSTNPVLTAEERIADPEIIVGGTTASYLWDCGDMEPYPYQFYTKSRKQTQRSDLLFFPMDFEKEDFRLVEGLPVANISLVLFDLKRRNYDLSLIGDIARDAKGRGLL